jgi:hypothetical protein
LFGVFLALINERRQTPLGLVHERLYRIPGLFRPVIAGDNRPSGSELGYVAGTLVRVHRTGYTDRQGAR